MDSARKIVVVPEGGLCLRALRDALGVSSEQVKPLLSSVLGAPRDYRWNGLTYVFNTAGARRLVAALQIEGVDVLEREPEDEPLAPRHTHHHGSRADGYQPDPED